MKLILHIWELMLFAAFVTLVAGIPAILWAESVMEDSDFERLGKPKPGEWLFHFHEQYHLKEEAAWTAKRLYKVGQHGGNMIR